MLKLKPESLDWALNHALLLGDTDVFPRPFEYEAIKYDWPALRSYLADVNVLDWVVRQHRSEVSAKAKLGFRAITQLDPLDFLLFAGLVRDICKDVEARRIPIAQQTVFSYRVKPTSDGRLYDPQIGYAEFVAEGARILQQDRDFTHVAITDISDFYSRIYHHRLENALQASTRKANHVAAIMGLLAGWNGTETFGIPVGSAPTRLLAEAVLIDVDEALLGNGIRFIRFNDDYRIFATSYTEAYRHLAVLAETLYRNHGLNLQKEKTHILRARLYERRYVQTAASRELKSLRDRFGSLIRELGLSDAYEPIVYEDLGPDQQRAVDALNLSELLKAESQAREPDYAVVRFVLRRVTQLGDDSAVDTILGNLEQLHPVFPDVIRYILSLTNLEQSRRWQIASEVLHLLDTSVISELAWHRMWALELFTHSTAWNHSDRFVEMLADCRDLLARRNLILALGRAGKRHWFQSRWRTLFEESPWPRRALIAAASCIPPDARRHLYRSIESRMDPLERAVAKWARAFPFDEAAPTA